MQIEYKTRGIRSMMLAPEDDKSSILEAERQARRRAEQDAGDAHRTIEQLRTRLAFAEAALEESRGRVSELSAELAQRQEAPPPALPPAPKLRPRAQREQLPAADEPIWCASWGKAGA